MPTQHNIALCSIATWFNVKHFLLERDRSFIRFKKLMKLIRLRKSMTDNRLTCWGEREEILLGRTACKLLCNFCGMDHHLFLDGSFSTASGHELLTHGHSEEWPFLYASGLNPINALILHAGLAWIYFLVCCRCPIWDKYKDLSVCFIFLYLPGNHIVFCDDFLESTW